MEQLKSINKTCDSLPSQWECITESNKFLYIRYRHGWLEVEESENKNQWDIGNIRTIFLKLVDIAETSGDMSTEEMLRHTGIKIKKHPK